MASAAWAAMTSHAAPPTAVESSHRGCRPRYSATSIGARVPSAVEPTPSMSSLLSPASASAARAAWLISPYGVPGSALPTPANATPAIATRRLIGLRTVRSRRRGPDHSSSSRDVLFDKGGDAIERLVQQLGLALEVVCRALDHRQLTRRSGGGVVHLLGHSRHDGGVSRAEHDAGRHVDVTQPTQ